MTRYEDIINKIVTFRDERDWEQFHEDQEIDDIDIERIKEELADVLTYSFFLAHKYNLDIFRIVEEKMIKNGQKYPREKAHGTAKKYTEL